ncbi:cysteine rich repeat-containing protein [Rhodoblastus sp.]|jgi:hypothetical protein|uniref:cysteine rich repeat-containing protein n=1 Tax=Rhodoblastus sp. TaxID=1962975 RepID=UPI0025EBD675|nr:cysteine rich repeat-containing protein [Rhodoblastus sp.]
MKIRVVAFSIALFSLSGASALAGGTQEQDAACRPDVRKYCHKIPPDAGDGAFLSCLQANRAKLSKPCREMLESNGV